MNMLDLVTNYAVDIFCILIKEHISYYILSVLSILRLPREAIGEYYSPLKYLKNISPLITIG